MEKMESEYGRIIEGKFRCILNLNKHNFTYDKEDSILCRLFGLTKTHRYADYDTKISEQEINNYLPLKEKEEFNYQWLVDGTYTIEELTDDEEIRTILRNGLAAYKSMSHMKQIKFDLLIEDINKNLYNPNPRKFNTLISAALGFGTVSPLLNVSPVYLRTPLLLIFEEQNANEYRKSILQKTIIKLPAEFAYRESDLNNIHTKVKATKEFIEEYRKPENRSEALKFIFWSLLAAAVDKTDYTAKITLIADFSHLLKVDEKALRDIIQVVKVVCGAEKAKATFQTTEVRDNFNSVLYLCSR